MRVVSGMAFRICSPPVTASVRGRGTLAMAGVTIDGHDRPEDAVAGADAVYADTWPRWDRKRKPSNAGRTLRASKSMSV